MSLEAIAALLGHRSMRMTLTYARISDRTVADEYFRVTEAVEANYGRTDALPERRRSQHAQLAADHRRMLGNGHVHPAGRPRLLLRVSLRALQLLRDRTPVHPDPPPPTGPRHRTRPGGPVALFDDLIKDIDAET